MRGALGFADDGKTMNVSWWLMGLSLWMLAFALLLSLFGIDSDEFDGDFIGSKYERNAYNPSGHFGCYGCNDRRKLRIKFSCSNFKSHEHQWYWSAWLCGRWQYLTRRWERGE
jgi:hypothetical protein